METGWGGAARGLIEGHAMYLQDQEMRRQARADALEQERERFEEELQASKEQRVQRAADVRDAHGALAALRTSRDDVGAALTGMQGAPGFEGSPEHRYYLQQASELNANIDAVRGFLYGPTLRARAQWGQALTDGLKSGAVDWRRLSPEDKYTYLSLHLGQDARRLTDNEDGPSAFLSAGREFNEGLRKWQQTGDNSDAIAPLNVLHQDALAPWIGEDAHDLSTVADARFARLDAHPQSPGQVIPLMEFSVAHPVRGMGSFVAPPMEDDQHNLSDPRQVQEQAVKKTSLADLLDRTGRRISLAAVANGDPQTRREINQGAANGNAQRAEALNQLWATLRRDPADYTRKPMVAGGYYLERDPVTGMVSKAMALPRLRGLAESRTEEEIGNDYRPVNSDGLGYDLVGQSEIPPTPSNFFAGTTASPEGDHQPTEAGGPMARGHSPAGNVLDAAATRKQCILNSGGCTFSIADNPAANSRAPWYELPGLSPVRRYAQEINAAAKEYGVDPRLIRAIMQIEETHGYYDAPARWLEKDDSIRPMNVNVSYWGDAFGTRKQLYDAKLNIRAGAKLLAAIVANMPKESSVAQIATIYNNLQAKQVDDYGARVSRIYDEQPWQEK